MNRLTHVAIITAGLSLVSSLVEASSSEPDTLAATREAADLQPGSGTARSTGALGLSLCCENDGSFVHPNGATDRHYTSGTGVAVQWQDGDTDKLVGAIPSIDDEFAPETPGTSFAGGVVLSLNMYTPEDISDPNPIYDDRPYAGWTYAGLIVQRADRADTVPVFEHMELDLGTVGPTGKAGDVQRWVHRELGYQVPEGWDNQIRDEVGLDFRYQRRWRMDLLGDPGGRGAGVQLIPEAGATLGTVHINAGTGALLRAGWNLPDDFGPGHMRFASDFTRSFANASSAPGGYFFIRSAGAIVGHDSTIDGSFTRNSPVEGASEVLTGEVQVGLAVQFLKYFELSYAQTYMTREFVGQKHIDGYGALNLTAVYTW
jgi:lipid A 3-O-deacylase